MKKTLLFCLCLIFVATGSVIASAAGESGFMPAVNPAAGGFSGAESAITSAKDAATMWDDARVILRGNIVQHLGRDKYLFKDASGTIRIEIDDDRWQGQVVSPGDTVELYGEVDKDWNSVEVEVKRIVKIQ